MNIGLLALSGIRVVDEELVSLGLTLPGFVERSEVIASLPSLGLLTLAALTPPEHDVEYLEVPNPRSSRNSRTASTWWPSRRTAPRSSKHTSWPIGTERRAPQS